MFLKKLILKILAVRLLSGLDYISNIKIPYPSTMKNWTLKLVSISKHLKLSDHKIELSICQLPISDSSIFKLRQKHITLTSHMSNVITNYIW